MISKAIRAQVSLPFNVQTFPALDLEPRLMRPSENGLRKGLGLLGLTLFQEDLCLFITVISSPEICDSQWFQEEGNCLLSPNPARGIAAQGYWRGSVDIRVTWFLIQVSP